MFQTDLLNKLQTMRYIDGNNMRTHLGAMKGIRDQLAETGSIMTDNSFNTYIQTSLSLTTHYRPLFTTLNTTAHITEVKILSADLIWHITKESNNAAMEESINQSNTAMAAAHARVTGNSGGQSSSNRNKGNTTKKCENCKKQGHKKEDCYAKGGGKADNPADWWKEKMARAKEKSNKSANAIDKESDDKNDNDNYAIIAVRDEDNTNNEHIPNMALVITTGNNHNALAVSKTAGIIVNSSTSSHFSPNIDKFVNYHKIMPEPVKATDSHTFSAAGKGDLKVNLPNHPRHKVITVTFHGVYYSPNIAFTLILVSCLNCAGCSVIIENGTCDIHGAGPDRKLLGSIPRINGLY